MERGPIALFGAIVAVGLGPALWLGVQFGQFDAVPTRSPAAVEEQHSDAAQLMGGAAAGETETGDDNTTPVRTQPRAHVVPLTATKSASPSASAHPSASASSDPSGSDPSDNQSATPSQSTDPSDGNGDHSQPPSPPTDSSSTGSPTGTGSGGSGSGGSGGTGGGGSGTGGGNGDSAAA